MMKRFVFLILLWSVGSSFSAPKNYYVIDGLHEDNSVIKLWYTVLGLLDEYDKGLSAGFEITFNQDGKHFSPECGSNWWDYYFAFNAIGSSDNSMIVRIPRYKRSVIRFNTVCTMSVERAHYLLKTYMHLQPSLQERFNYIKDIYWPQNIPVVGVYYQNQIMPGVQQSWSPVALSERVKQEAAEVGVCKILLFTAIEDFVIHFNNYFGSEYEYVLCFKNDEHTTPAQRGEHELLTLLLLAQCDLVIAPGSYQGTGAKMLNPALQLKELDIIPYALR